MWGLGLELFFLPWEFHRSGVMLAGSSSANWSVCTLQPSERRWRWAPPALQGNTALHCSPTFTFHSSPLSVLKSHPSAKHNLSISFVWLFSRSFIPALPFTLPTHLTQHFPATKNDVLTENIITFIGPMPMGGKRSGKTNLLKQATSRFTTAAQGVCSKVR